MEPLGESPIGYTRNTLTAEQGRFGPHTKMENMEQENRIRPLALIVVSGFARLLPHPPNFTPVGAMSLFAGAKLPGWQAFLVPLLIMAVTDPLLSLIFGIPDYTRLSPFIYGSFMLNVLIGRTLLSRSSSPIRIGSASFLCSLQFFLITNFGVWLGSHFYAQTPAGLAACLTAALPFFGRTMAGDLFFTAVLFGLHHWLSRNSAQLQTA